MWSKLSDDRCLQKEVWAKVNYTILSINDDRKPYKDYLRMVVEGEEITGLTFNAYESDPVSFFDKLSIDVPTLDWKPKRGELGVWASNYICWLKCWAEQLPLVVFEDDACPHPEFNRLLGHYMDELPDDWDFMTLWVPEDQLPDYYYNVRFDEYGVSNILGNVTESASKFKLHGGDGSLARVYQGYGNVAQLYSPQGAGKLLSLAGQDGLYSPVDCWLMMQARRGAVNGYAPHPDAIAPVEYDWKAQTTIHNTERL